MSPVDPAMAQLAQRLADASGPIIKRYFRTPMSVDDKDDASPVTIADKQAEEAIRAILLRECPSHGILGEEFGNERIDADYVWVIDPIDGTKAFITGIPIFGTLIALCHKGVPVLGVIDQPISGERWVGIAGHGATLNSKPIRTRSCDALSKAYLYATSPSMFRGAEMPAFERLAGKVKLARYGGDCYAYALVAMGFADIVVECQLKPFDYCALVPVIQGAGGTISDWRGAPLDLKSDGHVLACGDKRSHQAAMAVLAGA